MEDPQTPHSSFEQAQVCIRFNEEGQGEKGLLNSGYDSSSDETVSLVLTYLGSLKRFCTRYSLLCTL